MNEKMREGNTMILDGIRKAMKHAESYEQQQMYQAMKSQIYLMERDEINDDVIMIHDETTNARDMTILKCNQIINDVASGKDIAIRDVSILLQYALKNIDSKNDLCDSEILEIKTIRQCVKGL